MRRIKTFTLSLLTILLGVTAWAQVSREGVRKAPKAVGEITLVSANPADGATVSSLNEIKLVWSHGIDIVDQDSPIGVVKNAAGEKVADFRGSYGVSDDETLCNVDPVITTPGTYTVTVNENVFNEFDGSTWEINPNTTNAAVELTYIVDENAPSTGTRPVMVSISPAAPVETLTAIEVTFDQPVELSRSAGLIPCGVYKQYDTWTIITTANVAMKYGDDKTIVYTLADPISEGGTYCVDVEMGIVFPAGNPVEELGNEYFVASATVASNDPDPVVPDDGAKFNLVYPTSDTVEDTYSFGNINFEVAAGSKINAGVTPTFVNEKGESFNLVITDFISMMKTVILRADDVTVSGTYTLTVPAGFITDKDGKDNSKFVKTFTYVNPNQGTGDDDRKLELVYAKLVNNSTGEELDLLDPNTAVPMFGNGWTLKVLPNIFDVAKEINLAVSHYGIDEYGNEGIVYDKRIEMYEGNGCKTSECFQQELLGYDKLEEGTVYTLTFDAEDTHVSPDLRGDYGSVETTVKGGSKAFVYSSAELVSVFPEVDTEIYNVNQVFRLTFSEPVDIKVEMNLGQGASEPIYTAMPANEERTIWTFTFPASTLQRETAYVNAIISAKDDRGLIVKGNNGIEDKSVFSLSWDCHLGCPLVDITPASGMVESLFSFTAVAQNKGAINLGSGLDKPYLTTTSGARVAEVDMSSEVKYDASGNVISMDGAASDVQSVKVTFTLDKEVTAPGKYILVCPFAAFALGSQFSGSSSRPMFIEYTIDGTPEYSRTSIADGAVVKELSYVVVYADASVSFAEDAAMQLRTDEGIEATSDLILAVNNGVNMIIADFSDAEGKPLQLEPGMEYTLQISRDKVFLEGSDISFPSLSINITGADDAAETVDFTQTVAGLATSVSEVLKGSSAVVKLDPADGWKVGKVTFNNEDVTSAVKDNAYTTPALSADAAVTVDYAFDGKLFEGGSQVEAITDFALNVYSENGEIVVKGLKNGMIVNLFTVNGAAMGTYTVADGLDILNVKVPAGIYVLTITYEGKTQAVKIQNK